MKEYIEREALISALRQYQYPFGVEFLVYNQPAADVVERKRGEWVEKEFAFGDVYYDCSVCGESFCLIDGTPTDNLYSFCPNCGADMRQN